jgi:hypothetical protein
MVYGAQILINIRPKSGVEWHACTRTLTKKGECGTATTTTIRTRKKEENLFGRLRFVLVLNLHLPYNGLFGRLDDEWRLEMLFL